MPHALIEEFCRAGELRPEFFRRCQRVFGTEVQAQLDLCEKLKAENDHLLDEIRELNATIRALEAKRGPGRPRKVQPEDVEVGA